MQRIRELKSEIQKLQSEILVDCEPDREENLSKGDKSTEFKRLQTFLEDGQFKIGDRNDHKPDGEETFYNRYEDTVDQSRYKKKGYKAYENETQDNIPEPLNSSIGISKILIDLDHIEGDISKLISYKLTRKGRIDQMRRSVHTIDGLTYQFEFDDDDISNMRIITGEFGKELRMQLAYLLTKDIRETQKGYTVYSTEEDFDKEKMHLMVHLRDNAIYISRTSDIINEIKCNYHSPEIPVFVSHAKGVHSSHRYNVMQKVVEEKIEECSQRYKMMQFEINAKELDVEGVTVPPLMGTKMTENSGAILHDKEIMIKNSGAILHDKEIMIKTIYQTEENVKAEKHEDDIIEKQIEQEKKSLQDQYLALVSASNNPVREVPSGSEDSNRSSGSHTDTGRQRDETRRQDTLSTRQPFLNFWNLNFGDESRNLLVGELEKPLETDPERQSTMFLLDTSKSINGHDFTQMKNIVDKILKDANEVSRDNGDVQAKEAFGLAVFGRHTKILQAPIADCDSITNHLDGVEIGGRTPLGLGLILCVTIWFRVEGLQDTVWISGRKVHPKIIVITDMKPNETINYNSIAECEEDSSDNHTAVISELSVITRQMKKLKIPVFIIPVGKNLEPENQRYKLLKNCIDQTGGRIMDFTENRVTFLGRQAWHERSACIVMCNNRDEQDSWDAIVRDSILNEEDVHEVVSIIGRRTREQRRALPNESSTAEPGEQFWGVLPLGTRVQCPAESLGTVVAHAPDFQIIVYLDEDDTTRSFAEEQLQTVEASRSPAILQNQEIRLQIGCRVLVEVPEKESLRHKGIIIGVSPWHRNVFYVSSSRDPSKVGRYLYPNQIQYLDLHASRTPVWSHNINGDIQQFDSENNRIIEEAFTKNSRTKLVKFEGKQYRAIFGNKILRLINGNPNPLEFQLHRDPPYPS